MQFAVRAFQLAKDPEHPGQNEDAWKADPERGIAVVADGVASAIFSGRWATLLSEAVVADPPDPLDRPAFAAWLQHQRAAWSESIDTSGLAWFQKAKLPLGAFSTLLWVQVAPASEDEQVPGRFGARRLRGFAVGDSCLFHVRHGEALRCFPVQSTDEFEADPIVLGSVDLKRDQLVSFGLLEEYCFADDLLVLCTDAVAEWALRREQSGNAPDWMRYWYMTDEQWQAEISQLRADGLMRYDDATLVLLHIGGEPAGPPPATCSRAIAAERAAPAHKHAREDAVGSISESGQSGASRVRAQPQSAEDSAANLEQPEPGAGHVTEQEASPEWIKDLKREATELGQRVEQGLSDVGRDLREAGRKGWRKFRRWLAPRDDEPPPPPPPPGKEQEK